MKSFSNILDSFSQKINTGYVVVLFCIYIIFSLFVGGPGVIQKEMYLRMPLEISGKPLLSILFDVKTMNAGSWEARQLSYFFDVIDGKFVALSITLGFPNFRSFTHYLFSFLLVIVLWKSLTKDMKLNRLLSLMLIALLLTTPSFIYSYYYRTSKIGVTMTTILLLFGIFRNYRYPDYFKQWKPVLIFMIFFLTALALVFFDVLGVLIALVLGIYCFLVLVSKPDKNIALIFSGIFLACVTWAVFFLWLGPFLMFHITGQTADASFLATTPIQFIPAYLIQTAPVFLMDMIRFLIGYLPLVAALILFALITAMTIWMDLYSWKHREKKLEYNQRPWRKRIGSALLHSMLFNYIFLLVGISVVYAFLVIRHVEILWPDVRPVYYIMPAQAILLFGLSAWLSEVIRNDGLRKLNLLPVFVVLCLLFLGGNTFGSITIKDALYGGSNARANIDQNSILVLDSLKYHRDPGYIPPAIVATDPIYQLFAK